jgi:hypothetical protein
VSFGFLVSGFEFRACQGRFSREHGALGTRRYPVFGGPLHKLSKLPCGAPGSGTETSVFGLNPKPKTRYSKQKKPAKHCPRALKVCARVCSFSDPGSE